MASCLIAKVKRDSNKEQPLHVPHSSSKYSEQIAFVWTLACGSMENNLSQVISKNIFIYTANGYPNFILSNALSAFNEIIIWGKLSEWILLFILFLRNNTMQYYVKNPLETESQRSIRTTGSGIFFKEELL